MSDYTDILYSVADGVATIAINRPKRLNAATGHTTEELEAAIVRAEADKQVGVIVLTGVGERAFSVGGDLEWEGEGGLEAGDFNLNRQIVNCMKPVIARVDGYAIGAGNHWAYFCDFTICTDRAIFGQNGPKVAGPPGGYTSAHLVHVLGHKRAREMEMLCRKYTAQQALDWGLVNAVVPPEDLDRTVREWCDELLAMSPTCLKVLKASFRRTMDPYIDYTLADTIRQVNPGFFQSGEQQEGVAAFYEKGRPDFSKWW